MDIITQVAHQIMYQGSSMQPPLTLEKQVTITIVKLPPSSSLCYFTNQFVLGKSMEGEAILEVLSGHPEYHG